jgi:hypothetical protein
MMRRALTQFVLAGLLLGGTVGCTKPAVKEKPVPDPLLTSKKPVEGRSGLSSNDRASGEEMVLPPSPPASGLDMPPRPPESLDIVRLLGVQRVER